MSEGSTSGTQRNTVVQDPILCLDLQNFDAHRRVISDPVGGRDVITAHGCHLKELAMRDDTLRLLSRFQRYRSRKKGYQ
jgi:hypothetical protein